MRLSRVFAVSLAAALVIFASILVVRWSHPFPFERRLTQADGRKVEATVVGKTKGRVHVTTTADGQRYEYPMAQLSQADRLLLTLLAEQSPPPPLTPEVKESASYIENRERAIKENLNKIATLEAEIHSRTLSGSLLEWRRKEVADLKHDNEKMKADIANYKYRTKLP